MARRFASGDYLELASNAALDSGTVCFWIKTTQATSNVALFTRWSNSSRNGFGILQNSALGPGGIRVIAYTASTLQFFMDSTAINDGNWHHVGYVMDLTTAANGQKIYIDGSLNVQVAASNAWTCSGNIVRGGKTNDSFWANPTCDMAEICWHSAQLTANEIAALAKGVSPRLVRPSSLEMYLPLAA